MTDEIVPRETLVDRPALTSRERGNARAYANQYVKRGKLRPQPCEKCGTTENLEKHHEDYSRPLEVRWLCRPCHRAEHAPFGTSVPEKTEKKVPKELAAAIPAPHTCVLCGVKGRVIETRTHNGLTRRRIQCPAGHRFTTVEMRPPLTGSRAMVRRYRDAAG